jgi:hypothetical protein
MAYAIAVLWSNFAAADRYRGACIRVVDGFPEEALTPNRRQPSLRLKRSKWSIRIPCGTDRATADRFRAL